ncbi:hypothetical protein ACFW1M_23210, partial [Streptomyces inhibens]
MHARFRFDPRTRDYYERRIKEGKTRREIVRCLQRYAAREFFHLVRPESALREVAWAPDADSGSRRPHRAFEQRPAAGTPPGAASGPPPAPDRGRPTHPTPTPPRPAQ